MKSPFSLHYYWLFPGGKLPWASRHRLRIGQPFRLPLPKGAFHATKRKKRGGLVLDTSEGVLAGGDSGPAAVEILKRLKRLPTEEGAMPPKGPRFSPEEMDKLSKGLATLRPTPQAVPFWSLAPIRPKVPQAFGAEHPIDAFCSKTIGKGTKL